MFSQADMKEKTKPRLPSPVHLLFAIAISIFSVEMVIMYLFRHHYMEMILDSMVLVVVLLPMLYYFFYLPMLLHIKEVNRAREEIGKEKEFIQRLTGQMTEGLLLCDAEGGILWANSAFSRATGFMAEELAGMLPPFPFWGDDASASLYRQMMITGDYRRMEATLRKKDGEIFPVILNPYPIKSEYGNIVAYATLLTDITEQKRTEKKILEQSEFLENVIESLSYPFYVIDANNYTVLMANSAAGFGDLSNLPRCHVLTHGSATPCFHGDRHPCPVEEVKKTGKPAIVEHVHNIDGEEKVVEVHAHPILNERGEVAQIAEYLLDITERKLTENMLNNIAKGVSGATGEGFFKSLVEYLAKSLGVDYAFVGEIWGESSDKVKTIAVWAKGRPAMNFEYDLAHTPCENVVGREICIYPDNVQQAFPKDALLAEMGCQSYAGIPLFDSRRNPLGLLVVLHGKPFRNRKIIEAMLGIFAVRAAAEMERMRESEALREANEELRKALGKLEQTRSMLVRSEKLAAIGTLSSGVAHEILNPLNIIGTIVQMMQLDNAAPELEENLREIMTQVKRATKITNSLRMFAHQKREEDIGPVDVNALLDKTVQLLEHDLNLDGVVVERVYEKNIPSIHADEDKLSQVFLNFLTNSRDALRKTAGGVITLKTRSVDGRVEIRFSDNGPGIPEDIRSRIFDPFFTTKDPDKGTGLGLAISHSIVENHGGALEVESEAGKGATFILTLPLIGGQMVKGER